MSTFRRKLMLSATAIGVYYDWFRSDPWIRNEAW